MSVEDAIREAVAAELAPVREEIRAMRTELQQLRAAAVAPPAQDPDQQMALPDAARLAGKHPDTLRRAIKAGRLRASRPVGAREWSIRRGDVIAYIQGRGPGRLDEDRRIAEHVRRARKTG